MNDLNMKLLKQHVAILQTHMESVSRVLDSLATDAELLEGEMAERIPEAETVLAVSAKACAAEEKLSKAVEDLRFVMGGGDPCEVCATKCMMGVDNCKPIWRGEEVDG